MRFFVLAAALACANAFLAPTAPARPNQALRMSILSDKLEAQEKIALETGKKFGPQSPEAAQAWDVFEEMAAADNSISFATPLDEACEVADLENCKEYQAQMEQMKSILAANPAAPSVGSLIAMNKKLAEENARLRASLGAYKK